MTRDPSLERREFLIQSGLAAAAVATGVFGRDAGLAAAPTGSRAGAVPANRVRSVMRLFSSDVEDKAWFNDRGFWREYLSMLADARFNRFNLALGLGYDFATDLTDTYFYFAYPFLVAVPGYAVRAANLPDAERDRNLDTLRFISDTAVAAGLEFQLGLWTHAYVWQNSPKANYVIEGLTPDEHAAYCRDALARVLTACPNISGVTFRVHGESGVAEGSYGFWRTVFDGAVRSGRRIRIDMHAKGMDQRMIETALSTGLPLTISPKFWAEHLGLPYHQAAIRPTELPVPGRVTTGLMALSTGDRSFTRYGYGDLLDDDRQYDIVHRVWPGTQRMLLWGDPVFAAGYSRAMSFCGSAGGEIMEPLSFKGRKGSGLAGGRDGYADATLRAAGPDFSKFRYTYLLWGRMLDDPASPPDVGQSLLATEYGAAAADVQDALAHASRILPLVTTTHLPSAANNSYWPEMYVNMPIVDTSREPYGDTPTPRRFGTVSPLDPQLFARVDDHAKDLMDGRAAAKYSPIEVAAWLDDLASRAAGALARARQATGAAAAFRRVDVDVTAQAGLGRFFAQKLRAGVWYALFSATRSREFLDRAIAAYQAARREWALIVEATTGVYAKDVTYGPGWYQRGHWSDRLPAIDLDIAAMQKLLPAAGATPASPEIVDAVASPAARPVFSIRHAPADRFRRGAALELAIDAAGAPPAAARCLYRRTHQAEAWEAVEMRAVEAAGRRWHAALPAAVTSSTFPVQYYFELRAPARRGARAPSADDAVALYPGFNETLSNQPYFVVRPAR